jgi:quercetin dioxygenase-like cupin family protein
MIHTVAIDEPAGGAMGRALTDEPAELSWWFLDVYVVEHRVARAGSSTVLEMTLPVGTAPPAHVHHTYEDAFLMLEGELVVRSGDDVRVVRTGDWVCSPAGTPHAFRVVGERPARILSVLDAPTFAELIRNIGQPALAPGLPPAGLCPPAEEVFRAFAAHDVDVVGTSITAEEAQRRRGAGD